MNGFWTFMLIMNLLIPLVMMGFGKLFTIKPPKDINGFYGYRTSRAMKNQETWDFAHRHLGKRWFIMGIIMMVLTTLAMVFLFNQRLTVIVLYGALITMIQVVVLIISIFPTELALKKMFDEEGNSISDDNTKTSDTSTS